jgi:hypothetical protein
MKISEHLPTCLKEPGKGQTQEQLLENRPEFLK